MMGIWRDLTGMRFGNLVAVEYVPAANGKGMGWLCQCDCGGTTIARAQSLLSGQRSCSCRRVKKTHGMTETRAYRIWQKMLRRCLKEGDKDFHKYGARGITVCEEWKNFEGFIADMGQPPEGTSIDRIDGTKGYEPGNCRWATIFEQNRNRRNVLIITVGDFSGTIQDWSARTGMPTGTIHNRIKRSGMTPEDAVTLPVKKRRPNGYCEAP